MYANMKPQNEINEKHYLKLNLTDHYDLSCFFTHANHTHISLFSEDTLVRWKAGCSISMLYVGFSAKPTLKS